MAATTQSSSKREAISPESRCERGFWWRLIRFGRSATKPGMLHIDVEWSKPLNLVDDPEEKLIYAVEEIEDVPEEREFTSSHDRSE